MPSKSNKQKRNYKRRTPKSKNSKGTNKKSMYNRLKRRNTKKNQKGGVNLEELYKLKDELFMLLVLDIVDFNTIINNNNNYTVKVFDADKFKNNNTNSGKSGKSCSNFTTFLYLIEYLVDIGYLKTTEAQLVSKEDARLIKLFIPNIGNKEYNYIQQVYKNYNLKALSPNDYFKEKEVDPFFDKKLFEEKRLKYDLTEIQRLRALYNEYIQSNLSLYNNCDLVYQNIFGILKHITSYTALSNVYSSNNLYNKINDSKIMFNNMTLHITNLNTEINTLNLNTSVLEMEAKAGTNKKILHKLLYIVSYVINTINSNKKII